MSHVDDTVTDYERRVAEVIAPEPVTFVADASDDEDDAPVPYSMANVAPAPEVAGMAPQFIDPAKVAAREWQEIDRKLPLLTVGQRRVVLAFVKLLLEES